jgi:hypothetical protein
VERGLAEVTPEGQAQCSNVTIVLHHC